MRLILKEKPSYKEGGCREIKKFLFFPMRIGREWRWLEAAVIKQRYQILAAFDDNYCYPAPNWKNIEFVV